MVFSSFEIYKYSIPIEPFTIATGTMNYAQNIFVRAHTDAGITGVGECSAFPMIVGETQGTCFEMARDFAGIWKGKEADNIDDRMNELHLYAAGNYTAKSAFDMVLYDIAAKKAGLPLYKFLGGKKKVITSDLTIGIDTPEVMAQKALAYISQGVSMIKIKLGKKPEEDIERVWQIRKVIGRETELRVDANQGWNYEEALFALQALGEFNIRFCEQPMRKWNDELLPELCRRSPVPVMADESVYTHHDADRILRNKAAEYINIKFAKSGGIQEAMRIIETARQYGVKCMIGSMLESRLALTANVHFAMAFDDIVFYDLDTCLLGQLEDPVIGGVVYRGMDLHIEDVPGIGAEVDQSYLERCVQVII